MLKMKNHLCKYKRGLPSDVLSSHTLPSFIRMTSIYSSLVNLRSLDQSIHILLGYIYVFLLKPYTLLVVFFFVVVV